MILAVITTDQPDANGLRREHGPRVVDAVGRQRFAGRKILACDGPAPLWLSGAVGEAWEILVRPKEHKDNGAIVRALLGDLVDAGEDVLVLEDDVELSEGALDYIEAHGVPAGLAAISWFEATFRTDARAAVYRVPAVAWAYGQAVTLRAETVRALCAAPWDLELGWDTNVASILRGAHLGIHVPALVQHVGVRSIAHPERGFAPVSHTYFPGALHLPRGGIPC